MLLPSIQALTILSVCLDKSFTAFIEKRAFSVICGCCLFLSSPPLPLFAIPRKIIADCHCRHHRLQMSWTLWHHHFDVALNCNPDTQYPSYMKRSKECAYDDTNATQLTLWPMINIAAGRTRWEHKNTHSDGCGMRDWERLNAVRCACTNMGTRTTHNSTTTRCLEEDESMKRKTNRERKRERVHPECSYYSYLSTKNRYCNSSAAAVGDAHYCSENGLQAKIGRKKIRMPDNGISLPMIFIRWHSRRLFLLWTSLVRTSGWGLLDMRLHEAIDLVAPKWRVNSLFPVHPENREFNYHHCFVVTI